jgi:hypothetical protein
MSNIESINLSIKIDGKAIDVTYKGWTKINHFDTTLQWKPKILFNVAKKSLNVIAMHIFPIKVDRIIIDLSKVAIRPWMNKVTSLRWNLIIFLSLAKDKKIVHVTIGNNFMFDKTFGNKKGCKRIWKP